MKENFYVIKCGGFAFEDEKSRLKLIQDICVLKQQYKSLIFVHGGGNTISELSRRFGLSPKFVNGQRVTDLSTLDVVKMALIKINCDYVAVANAHGLKSIGISGHDDHFIKENKEKKDSEFLTQSVTIKTQILNDLLELNYTPIVAPLAVNTDGQFFNCNADVVAASIAGALVAEKCIFLSDIDGVYKDFSDKSTLIKKLSMSSILEGIENKKFQNGMIPKLESCIHAIQQGVKGIHILNAKDLLSVFTENYKGTKIGV